MYVSVGGPKGKEQVAVLEAVRIPGTNKKKTRTVKNYGYLSELLKSDPHFVENLKQEIANQRIEKKNTDKVLNASITLEDLNTVSDQNPIFSFGHMIVKRLWTMMQLDEFFDKTCNQKKNKEELIKAIYFLVAHRLGSPASILSTKSEQKNYAGVEEVTLDVLYSVLDVLADYREDLIEHLSKFFSTHTKRQMDNVCYDVTNYYFESTDEGQLRLFGYSKEHKNNEVLVVMGLLIDSNGIPVTMQLFPGNTMDQNTLTDAVQNLEELYGMKNITVVADRGMNSGENLVFISDNSHHFVISYTMKKAKAELKNLCLNGEWDKQEYLGEDGELSYASKVMPYKVKAKVPLTEEEINRLKEDRKATKVKGRCPKYREAEVEANIHITYSKERAEKDKKDRERAVEKLKKRISKPGFIEQSIHYGANKYLQIETDAKTATINQERIDEDAKWDGYYAVVTDKTELITEQVMEIYGSQWKIEESFRILKTDLEARPVYVWTDNHISGHFVMCYIALSIIRYLQYLLKEEGKEVLSAARIMDSIEKPKIVVAGRYPNMILQPVNLNEEFLELIQFLKFPKLQNAMTITHFKAVTKLNINDQLKAQLY